MPNFNSIGSGVSEPQVAENRSPIDWRYCPYNSVRTNNVLHCDYDVVTAINFASFVNKMLSYRRETALQGTLVLAESGRLELGDNILLIL